MDQSDVEADPGDPDDPLDPVELRPGSDLVVDGLAEFLQGAGRTCPAAPQPAHEQGRQELQSEHDEAATDDALVGTPKDEHG